VIDGFSFLFITPGQRYFAESGIQPLGSSTRSFCSRKEYWNPRPWRKPSFEHTVSGKNKTGTRSRVPEAVT